MFMLYRVMTYKMRVCYHDSILAYAAYSRISFCEPVAVDPMLF